MLPYHICRLPKEPPRRRGHALSQPDWYQKRLYRNIAHFEYTPVSAQPYAIRFSRRMAAGAAALAVTPATAALVELYLPVRISRHGRHRRHNGLSISRL